jgi:hypothetical protein
MIGIWSWLGVRIVWIGRDAVVKIVKVLAELSTVECRFKCKSERKLGSIGITKRLESIEGLFDSEDGGVFNGSDVGTRVFATSSTRSTGYGSGTGSLGIWDRFDVGTE